MSLQLDLFVKPDQFKNQVISEEPYVKILGEVGWSYKHHSWAAVAQVNNSICFIALRLKLIEPEGNHILGSFEA